MKILLIIDNLASGGSQRQLCLLGRLLKKRNHDVIFVTYNEGNFFNYSIIHDEIKRIEMNRISRYIRPISMARVFRNENPECVIAFQEAASLYTEMASIFSKRWTLIVSERTNCKPGIKSIWELLLPIFHIIADYVTTNTDTKSNQLSNDFPFLRKKIRTIYNGVEIDLFRPEMKDRDIKRNNFIVLASHKKAKNFSGLARAVRHMKDEHANIDIKVDWYGDEGEAGWKKANIKIINELKLNDTIFIHSSRKDVEILLWNADALILPSLWEGMPNVVYEAFAAECPVLMSDVNDARRIIKDGETGFLFDPKSPKSIAQTIMKYIELSDSEKRKMGLMARTIVENKYNPDIYVNSYLSLIDGKRKYK